MLWPLWLECANNAGLADQSLPQPPPLKQRHYVTALHCCYPGSNWPTLLLHHHGPSTSSRTELNVVRGTSKRMELCHCKGRIREFVTLEKRFIRGMGKGKRRRGGGAYPQVYSTVMFLMSSFSVVGQITWHNCQFNFSWIFLLLSRSFLAFIFSAKGTFFTAARLCWMVVVQSLDHWKDSHEKQGVSDGMVGRQKSWGW